MPHKDVKICFGNFLDYGQLISINKKIYFPKFGSAVITRRTNDVFFLNFVLKSYYDNLNSVGFTQRKIRKCNGTKES